MHRGTFVLLGCGSHCRCGLPFGAVGLFVTVVVQAVVHPGLVAFTLPLFCCCCSFGFLFVPARMRLFYHSGCGISFSILFWLPVPGYSRLWVVGIWFGVCSIFLDVVLLVSLYLPTVPSHPHFPPILADVVGSRVVVGWTFLLAHFGSCVHGNGYACVVALLNGWLFVTGWWLHLVDIPPVVLVTGTSLFPRATRW
jgi:hypothetical protein